MVPYLVTVIVSFVVGSIPFGWIIARINGVDIKKEGSGNIGATNVYRVVGKKEGIITLVLDLLKGFVVVVVFSYVYRDVELVKFVSALSVVAGHDFSIFLFFKGGKGVATSYGATLFLYPLASIVGIIIWIGILLFTKYSSLAALISFLVATLIAMGSGNYYVRLVFIILYILMVYRHKDNIRRLFKKEEQKVKI